MPFTTLDTNTALVVIDMQTGIAALPLIHPVAEISARVAQLTAAFRARGLPVVLVNVVGGPKGRTDSGVHHFAPPADWIKLLPELDQQAGDHLVSKLQLGAFQGTSLDHFLRRQGVTQIVLCGIATSIGVESTARVAYDSGYHVSLVTDAMTDLKRDAHDNSVKNIFPRVGETGSTADLLALLPAK